MPNDIDQVDPTGGALDGIAAEATALEGQQEQQQAQATAEPENPMGGAVGWMMIAKGIGSAISVALPEVKEAYTDEACMGWGQAMDALCIKYGWEGGASRFGPEIAVAFASLGLVAPVVTAIKHRKMIQARLQQKLDQVGAEPMKNGGPITEGTEGQP